jgi:ABC-type multidrug transport system fused ATPase/permease subunit
MHAYHYETSLQPLVVQVDLSCSPRIEVRGLSFNYRGNSDLPVLTDINFVVPAKALVALVGVNASGKSTLVNLLLGLHRPTSGSIVSYISTKTSYNQGLTSPVPFKY